MSVAPFRRPTVVTSSTPMPGRTVSETVAPRARRVKRAIDSIGRLRLPTPPRARSVRLGERAAALLERGSGQKTALDARQ